jgi:hypothetical protein
MSVARVLLHRADELPGSGGGTFNSRAYRTGTMTDWPKDVGGHAVTEQWECADCGADFDCLSQFRRTDCS